MTNKTICIQVVISLRKLVSCTCDICVQRKMDDNDVFGREGGRRESSTRCMRMLEVSQ